jgi:hypothetical protein
MAGKIDVQEERDFPLGERASRGKETAVKGSLAGVADGGEDGGPVVWPERADFDARPIVQHFNRGIRGCFGHRSSPRTDPRSVDPGCERAGRARARRTAGLQRFRAARSDIARMQRAMAELPFAPVPIRPAETSTAVVLRYRPLLPRLRRFAVVPPLDDHRDP